MAKKETSPNPIPNLSERWDLDTRNGLPYSGNAVQDHITPYLQMAQDAFGGRFGSAYFDSSNNTMYFFKNEEDKNEWLSSGASSLVLEQALFQFSGKVNQMMIVNEMESNKLSFTTNSEVAEITFGFLSQEKNVTDTEWQTLNEDAYITVSVDKGSSGSYEDIVTNRLLINGSLMTIDIRQYLATGANRVRVSATGAISGTVGNLIYTVTLTSMYLSPSNFNWYTPFIEGKTYSLGGVNIGGTINKTLHIKMANENGYEKRYEANLGTQTYITNAYFFNGLQFPTAGTGVYSVEMWLDADGLESEHLHYNIMCVSASEANTAQLVCISEYPASVINYSENLLFKYAIYNGGASFGSPHLKISSVVNTNPTIIKEETLTNVTTGVSLSYNIQLEVDTEEADLQLRAELTFGNEQVRQYVIDNSMSYPATRGASFYLNAANRNNAQSNVTTIINEVTKATYAAEWTNMSWKDDVDGWTTDDSGRKCLYLPAMTKCNLHYKPMSVMGNGKVIEFNFKVSNVANYDEPIITICDDPNNENFRGIKITPSNIVLHSRDLNTADSLQSYSYREEEPINLLITIIRNYKTNYGNIAQIYVNGVKKCSFEFDNADSWINDANVILGNNTSDLSLYNMRVYDIAFGFADAQKNYVGSLTTTKDKTHAHNKINEILDGNTIDYDHTTGKYNCMVIEMLNGAELPHYGLSKEYSAFCNVTFEYADHPEWNFTINNIRIEGQGTTSMNYYRWNLRFRLDKSPNAVIVYANGSTSTKGKVWFDGEFALPEIQRITAKKNFASSMQSHKMGATEAYNAIQQYLGYTNEVNGRTAVLQYPFVGFLKTKIEGSDNQYVQTYNGNFTAGPDKGDKATFGYDNPQYKDTLIHLEGTDHSIKGVGFDYPWSELKYIASEEAICVDRGNEAPEAAWEVGASGSASTESEIQAYLNQEFKPAYEHVYNNSIMIMGTAETISTINANPTAWGMRKDEEGHSYQRYEFWIDGEYDLYYLSRKTNRYEKNGVNLLTQLGISASSLSGKTIEEKNEIFKQARIQKFVEGFEDYFDKNDVIYCLVFLLIFGASDNFKKNFYPYKFGTLDSGSRWRMRQDDLDTLIDIDNQGLSSKKYSIETFDWTDDTKTAYVFKGESSSLVQNIFASYSSDIKLMGNRILGAMYELADSGTNTLDRLLNFFEKYFWDKAQDYFPKSAYNVDAEYTYEEAWPPFNRGEYIVDVNPLGQSLGDHYEAEKAWVEKRLIYTMSKFSYGPFAQYNDATLGQVSVRTQLAQDFTLTPAIDLYPAVLVGQSGIISSGRRINAGESINLVGAGGENTNVYIKAVDYLSDIGDLSKLSVEAGNGIAISSKRLQRIKVGDETVEEVTSNLSSLTIGECPSVTSIDARNLSSLTGTVDLSHCPRLQGAYFGGTNLRAIILANGSKITSLELGENLTQLQLMNLKFLNGSEFSVGSLGKVEFFRVEGCSQLNPFQMLKDTYNLDESSLRDVRLIGFVYDGDATDIDMLVAMAQDKDKGGNDRSYNGIDSEGNPQIDMLPIIEGQLNIEGSVYEDTSNLAQSYYPNLVLNVSGGYYIRFKDAEVLRVLLANGVDTNNDGGIARGEVEAVTTIGTWFRGNTTIQSFEEFAYFKNCKSLVANAFDGCTALNALSFPQSITSIGAYACYNVPAPMVLNAPNLTTIETAAFHGSGLTEIKDLGKVSVIGSTGAVVSAAYGMFVDCKALTKVHIPSSVTHIGGMSFVGCTALTSISGCEGVKTIGRQQAFDGCTALVGVLTLPSIQSIDQYSFRNCKFEKIDLGADCVSISAYAFQNNTSLNAFICRATTPPSLANTNALANTNNCPIYVPDASVNAYKAATNWSSFASRIKPLSEYVE